MTEIIIQKNDAGQRADRFLAKAYPIRKNILERDLRLKAEAKLKK